MLQISLAETLEALSALTDEELDEPSDHPCAMGGTVRDLLTHNIDHERMHVGQIYSARYLLKTMQKGEVQRLLADTLRARSEVIASLIGLPDDMIDTKVPDEDWTFREMIEHTVYWERHSIDDLRRRRLADRLEQRRSELADVVDPLYGDLPQVDLNDAVTPTPVPDPAQVKHRERPPALADLGNGHGSNGHDSHAHPVELQPILTASALPLIEVSLSAPDAVFYAPDLTYRTKDDVVLAIDGEKPHWISTNRTGAEVLRLCDGHHTVGEIASILSQRNAIAYERVVTQTFTYLEGLRRIDFLSDRPRTTPQYRGRAEAIDLGRLSDLYLFVTNDCNLRCTHCYVSSGDFVPAREMQLEEMIRVVDEARALGVGQFQVTGGEPFMVRGIYDLLEHITAESDAVVLTNGMFLTPKNIKRLTEMKGTGKLSFQISIDGPTAELHNAIRGKGAFEVTMRHIPQLVEAGFNVTISTAISTYTIDHMADMTRLVASLGVKQHHILWMQEWGRALDHQPELMIPPARVSQVMREVRQVAEDLGVTLDNEASLRLRVRGKQGRKTDLCSCAWESLAVFSDGQVYPCVWMAGAPGLECGNVLEQPLEQIWRHSPLLQEVRRTSVQQRELCNDCHLKFICAGGSPCSSYFGSLATKGKGDFLAAEPYCETFMDLTHDMLWEQATAGIRTVNNTGQYHAPLLYNAMEGQGAKCMRPNTVAKDRAFEVGAYHCVCVLEPDVEEGVAMKPALPTAHQSPDGTAAQATFDAIGKHCVELLVTMARQVRTLPRGDILEVLSDDPAAHEDLTVWCRMTGNHFVEATKRKGYTSFFIRREEH
jgi:radical SAM protein with 4Fe4S-binding SPASM domain